MLIIDMSAIKLPGEVKQNNQPLKCGQPTDAGKNPRLKNKHTIGKIHTGLANNWIASIISTHSLKSRPIKFTTLPGNQQLRAFLHMPLFSAHLRTL
jgi:hypothetical protein